MSACTHHGSTNTGWVHVGLTRILRQPNTWNKMTSSRPTPKVYTFVSFYASSC
jgi:hypothetical protein